MSRKEVIKLLKLIKSTVYLGNRKLFDALEFAINYLNQPKQQWIPCSDRLPDEYEWIGTKKFGTTMSDEVYVTFEAPDGQRFADHIIFQNGKLSPADEQRINVWFKGAKPIAWMPLPEPYEERREE